MLCRYAESCNVSKEEGSYRLRCPYGMNPLYTLELQVIFRPVPLCKSLRAKVIVDEIHAFRYKSRP
jgi:hypothetical protein